MAVNAKECERILRDVLAVQLEELGYSAKREVARTGKIRPRGWIDIVTTDGAVEIGIELKVCELPRTSRLSDSQCLWEVGQILWDYVGLKESPYDAGYCVVFAYTRGLYALHSEKFLLRSFHNAMFCDLQQSLEFGELAREGNLENRRNQLIASRELGWDKPFGSRGRAGDFAVSRGPKMAAMGYFVAGGGTDCAN
jgi:hypothetical protein